MRASTCARACARARSHLASHLAVCVAQRAHLRQRVAHVPRAHAQLDLLRRLVAAVLEHRVRRARARGLVGEVESVAVEAVRGRERHVQPAVALALGALLVDAVDVLHVEAARLVALAPQHEVATCHSAAEASSGGGGAGWRTRAWRRRGRRRQKGLAAVRQGRRRKTRRRTRGDEAGGGEGSGGEGERVLLTCLGTAYLKLHVVALAWTVPPPPRLDDDNISHGGGGGPAKLAHRACSLGKTLAALSGAEAATDVVQRRCRA